MVLKYKNNRYDSNTITEINHMRNTKTKGLSITNRNAYQQKSREKERREWA